MRRRFSAVLLVPIKFMIGQEKYFVCLMSRRKFTRRFLVQSKLCDGEKIQSSERSTDRVNNPGVVWLDVISFIHLNV